MRKLRSILAVVCIAVVPAAGAHITSVDQENTADVASGTPDIVGDGQSFTPTFAVMNAVDLAFVDIGGGAGATVQIRIRDGSGLGGAILGTSDALFLPDGFGFAGATGPIPAGSIAEFVFSAPVALTPGAVHTIEFLNLGGDPIGWRGVASDVYPGGQAFFDGGGSPQDGWFRTGLTAIPEPSSLILFATGICALILSRRRR